MPKPISADRSPALNVVLITLDNHMTAAVDDARRLLSAELPTLNMTVHAATDWNENEQALEACKTDIAKGHIIVASMLFLEEHVKAIGPALLARRDDCDAMMCCMSAGEIMQNTRMGRFSMAGEQKGPIALLKKLRGDRGKGKDTGKTAGERQLAMLRRLPKLLRFIPGTAQDLRNYFIALQYRIAASDENIANLVRLLVSKYSTDERSALRKATMASDPIHYPEAGIYHPTIKNRISTSVGDLPFKKDARGTVGLLLLRTYILSGDTGHYDGVIAKFEAAGLNVVPVFCAGLDMRTAISKFLSGGEGRSIDAMVSLTGFSLVGGPAYSDSSAAAETLQELDIPYISANVTEFQTLEKWQASDQGLMPIESTIMVAIPELDGATGSIVYGGRRDSDGTRALACTCSRELGTCPSGRSCMRAHDERVSTLAARVVQLVELRRRKRSERRIALTIFNFPPNAGNVGSAAFLSVFESLYATLERLKAEGYSVELPDSVDALREEVLHGNAARYGTVANVHHLVSAEDHVRGEPHLAEIEAQWGPAPGRVFTNGGEIFIHGKAFGNVLVAIQPGFGYEGDPMRLLFEKGLAPTHAFAAFYRYLRETFQAHAVLHFGTHGALEFMPGKQVGLSGECWPERLIGDLPNFYLYAANNPSEGTIAKRRSGATLVSYLTPPVTHAGLYKGLSELKGSLDRLRSLAPEAVSEREHLLEAITSKADQLDLSDDLDAADTVSFVKALSERVLELEYTLIPHGLHVAGRGMDLEERIEMLRTLAGTHSDVSFTDAEIEAIASGQAKVSGKTKGDAAAAAKADIVERLVETNAHLMENRELDGIVHALDARFVEPSASGDLIRTPEMLPTGRNIHGFDPFGIPSAFAVADGARQAAKVLARHLEQDGNLPETIAIVLWGTDNLKTEGGPIGQAMALIGAKPRLDAYNRVCGAELIRLEDLGRPRIDAVITLSGIFRDLLPIQASMLAEACYLAAIADEPVEQNFVRKHALAYAEENACDLEQAAYRVFSNAEGAYGANVNYLIGSSAWTDDQELADTYTSRKSFAINRKGKTSAQPALLGKVLSQIDLTYQNLDSVELGVTTIDHYFDTLGGITKAASIAKGGKTVPVYISDQTHGEGKVRTLEEQVSLETRTRSLNPKWFEGMLEHGYEGVREIESQISNTMGWSATTGGVQPWVYQQLSETFVLDEAMRRRLSALNPEASARVANKLIEAHERQYWQPDEETLNALRAAGEELEDRVEGIVAEAAE